MKVIEYLLVYVVLVAGVNRLLVWMSMGEELDLSSEPGRYGAFICVTLSIPLTVVYHAIKQMIKGN